MSIRLESRWLMDRESRANDGSKSRRGQPQSKTRAWSPARAVSEGLGVRLSSAALFMRRSLASYRLSFEVRNLLTPAPRRFRV